MCLGGKKDTLDIVSNHSEQSATTYDPNSEETTNNECDDYDEDNFETALESFEAYTSKFIKVYAANFYPMKTTTGTGNYGVPAGKTCTTYGKGL